MKDKKFIYGSILVCVFLLTMGLTYAYFSLTVSGNDVAETINVSATKLELKYTDGKEVRSSDIEPGWTTTKTITVVNTGNEETYYTLGWQKLYNEIQKNELVIRSTCTSSGVTGGSCDNTDNAVVPQTTEVSAGSNKVIYPYKEATAILPGETHTYTITIEFINYADKHQNYNQGKKFYGVLGIVPAYNTYSLTLNITNSDGTPAANSEVTLHSNPMTGTTDSNGNVTFNNVELGDHTLTVINNNKTISTAIKLTGGTNDIVQTDSKYNVKIKKENITLNVKLSDSNINNFYVKGKRRCLADEGATSFVDGQYTYTYSNNEWGVKLTDATSTDPVTTEFCYMVNDKYVTDMSGMFFSSQATSLDLSSFDTSKVNYMDTMFYDSQATSLDLSSFDTSNVTNMSGMFSNSPATSLDLSSFDTSNVTDMSYMFSGSQATSLDLSSFDTSNVTAMSGMFFESQATSLKGLNRFDTSKVTNMSSMFSGSKATSLDLSSFDTSKVTDMSGMFFESKATSLKGLNRFDTSKVNYMYTMFSGSKATSLDLSSFDTSKVTNMSGMFSNSQATSLDLSGFDTSSVTDMSGMFFGSQATSIDLSSFDTSNVNDMSGIFTSSKVTSGYARNQVEADKFNNEAGKTIFTVKK